MAARLSPPAAARVAAAAAAGPGPAGGRDRALASAHGQPSECGGHLQPGGAQPRRRQSLMCVAPCPAGLRAGWKLHWGCTLQRGVLSSQCRRLGCRCGHRICRRGGARCRQQGHGRARRRQGRCSSRRASLGQALLRLAQPPQVVAVVLRAGLVQEPERPVWAARTRSAQPCVLVLLRPWGEGLHPPGALRSLVIVSNCRPFLATKSASLSATERASLGASEVGGAAAAALGASGQSSSGARVSSAPRESVSRGCTRRVQHAQGGCCWQAHRQARAAVQSCISPASPKPQLATTLWPPRRAVPAGPLGWTPRRAGPGLVLAAVCRCKDGCGGRLLRLAEAARLGRLAPQAEGEATLHAARCLCSLRPKGLLVIAPLRSAVCRAQAPAGKEGAAAEPQAGPPSGAAMAMVAQPAGGQLVAQGEPPVTPEGQMVAKASQQARRSPSPVWPSGCCSAGAETGGCAQEGRLGNMIDSIKDQVQELMLSMKQGASKKPCCRAPRVPPALIPAVRRAGAGPGEPGQAGGPAGAAQADRVPPVAPADKGPEPEEGGVPPLAARPARTGRSAPSPPPPNSGCQASATRLAEGHAACSWRRSRPSTTPSCTRRPSGP